MTEEMTLYDLYEDYDFLRRLSEEQRSKRENEVFQWLIKELINAGILPETEEEKEERVEEIKKRNDPAYEVGR